MSLVKKTPESEYIVPVEDYLQRMMPQVVPREDFVASLRQRLMTTPSNANWLPTAIFFIILTLAGLVSGMILIATSLRGLVTVFATLSLIYKYRITSKRHSSPSAQISR